MCQLFVGLETLQHPALKHLASPEILALSIHHGRYLRLFKL